MGKCRNCNIEILDQTDRCPLCSSVLEPTDELENMYPNVRRAMQPLHLLARVYLFCALAAEAVLIGLNYIEKEPKIWWSVISGLILFYIYILFRYAILGKSGYASKVFILALIAVVSSIAIDIVTGNRGWAFDYVLPAGILIIDLIIMVCMFINRRNWQSYIMWQMLMLFCSLVPILFYYLEFEKFEYLVFLPMAVSAALFSGTMIIGGRRALMELKRRFHT